MLFSFMLQEWAYADRLPLPTLLMDSLRISDLRQPLLFSFRADINLISRPTNRPKAQFLDANHVISWLIFKAKAMSLSVTLLPAS